jgi:hypothetical protein
MGLACIELAPFAGARDLVGVGNRCGPVEALAERVSHEGARCGVMTAHTCVDVSDELSVVGNRDVPLPNPERGALVQLAINHGE